MTARVHADAAVATAAPAQQPLAPRKRDTLFLPPSESTFSFGFTEGHLPISAGAGDDDDARLAGGDDDNDDDANEEEGGAAMLRDGAGGDSRAEAKAKAAGGRAAGGGGGGGVVTAEQALAACNECRNCSLAFFGLARPAPTPGLAGATRHALDRAAHVENVRKLFAKARQVAATPRPAGGAKSKKRKGGAGADDSDE